MQRDMKWKTLKSEYIIRRPWLTARRDTVELPTGVVNDEYYVLEYPTWVNVIAVTKDGEYVMIRQYRHGIGRTGTEIVAGVCEEGEQPEAAARRELMEETGYSGGTWRETMVISANTSTMNNVCHCFMATGVERAGSQHLDRTEDIDVCLMSRDELQSDYMSVLYRREGVYWYRDKEGLFEASIERVCPDGMLLLRDVGGAERRYAFKEVAFIL